MTKVFCGTVKTQNLHHRTVDADFCFGVSAAAFAKVCQDLCFVWVEFTLVVVPLVVGR